MKVLILGDRASLSYGGWDLYAKVCLAVKETGADVAAVVLNGDELGPCLGCYMCWVKTPGFCIRTNDNANALARQEIQADAVVFLSKITYGGFSYDLKSFLDRSIPNLSPYFEIVLGDMRHGKRYERFPQMISIGYGADAPEEEQTFISLAARNALIMRPLKHFAFTLQNKDELNQTTQALKKVLLQEVR